MAPVHIELDQDIVALLEDLCRRAKAAARELIARTLPRGALSSGRGAELLDVSREEFIRLASARGIPYFQLLGEELRREIAGSDSL